MKIIPIYLTLTCLIFFQFIKNDSFAQGTGKNEKRKKPAPATHVTGQFIGGQPEDTVVLEVLKEFGSSARTFSINYSLMEINSEGFRFTLPELDRPVYITLHTPYVKGMKYYEWQSHLLEAYLLMPGDSIHISFLYPEKKIVFSGRSAEQFTWQYESRRMVTREISSQIKAEMHTNPEQWFANKDTILDLVFKSLEGIKEKIRPDIYTILKADAIGMYLGNTYMNLNWVDFAVAYKDSGITNRVINTYNKKLYHQVADTAASDLLAKSCYYAAYLLEKVRSEYLYKRHKGESQPSEFFTALSNVNISGILKEKMILAYLYQRIGFSKLTDNMIEESLKIVHNPRYRNMLLTIQQTYAKGQPVDGNYVFRDKENNAVRLSDYKGKVVFVDLWFTGCSGCIKIAAGLPKVEEQFYNNPNVVFISLSIDKDKAKWMRSIDPDNKVIYAINAKGYTHYTTSHTKYLYTGGEGSDHPFVNRYNPTNSYPHLLLIDKKGRIVTANVPSPVDKEGQDNLIRLIKEAINK